MLGPALVLLSVLGAPASPGRLAVIQEAPDFALTTQEGKSARLADYRGRVLLVGFIFTTCSGTCPATTHRMSQVQQELRRRGLTKDGRVQLLSITLDPARDTPEALRNYMRLYDLDAAAWSFLTGPADVVQRTIAAWGMWARPTVAGQLDHPSRVYLVDSAGRVREIYNLDFLRPAWAADDIALLLQEAAPATP